MLRRELSFWRQLLSDFSCRLLPMSALPPSHQCSDIAVLSLRRRQQSERSQQGQQGQQAQQTAAVTEPAEAEADGAVSLSGLTDDAALLGFFADWPNERCYSQS